MTLLLTSLLTAMGLIMVTESQNISSDLSTSQNVTLDLKQAARLLRMHPVTLMKKARSGEIPGAKVGKQWVFIQVDLLEYIRAQYSSRALQGEHVEGMTCHSINGKTRPSGGLRFPSKDEKQYRKALGLPTG